MAGPGRRRSGGTRSGGTSTRAAGGARNNGAQRRRRPDEEGLIPVLAGIAREVDNAVQHKPTKPGIRTKFQVVALLVREERARVMADASLNDARRTHELKRLDGVATQLARIAARDTTLLSLLAEDARVSDAARDTLVPGVAWFGWRLPAGMEVMMVVLLGVVLLGVAIVRFDRTE